MSFGEVGGYREMPRYRCHKQVWALKIAGLTESPDGKLEMTAEESGFAPIVLDADFVAKHKPKVGGYYVVYDDGYTSFSPATAFEKGYARI